MNIDNEKIINKILEQTKLIDSNDIPAIDLYMDQVTTFMDKHLSAGKRFDEDKILTKTMINNYAKNELIPSPEKKKYSKDHVLMLVFIYYFKNILSINDIKTLLKPVSDSHFGNTRYTSLEDIYKEITKLETESFDSLREELLKDVDACDKLFANCKASEKDFLKQFSLISYLSFDIYIKKQIIESIIDNINEEDAKAKARAKKEAAAKARAKKEAKKEDKKDSKTDIKPEANSDTKNQ